MGLFLCCRTSENRFTGMVPHMLHAGLRHLWQPALSLPVLFSAVISFSPHLQQNPVPEAEASSAPGLPALSIPTLQSVLLGTKISALSSEPLRILMAVREGRLLNEAGKVPQLAECRGEDWVGHSSTSQNWPWWCTPVTPAPRRCRQMDQNVKILVGYVDSNLRPTWAV